MTKRFLSLIAVAAFAATAACGGDAEETETVQQDTFVTTETEMAPVVTPVETQDTGIVETTIETEVDVDTIERP